MEKWRRKGSILNQNKGNSGPKRSVKKFRTDESITSVEARIQESSQSVRKIAAELGINRESCSKNFEKGSSMTSLSYGRIFCLESQKIDGTYQRYNHYFNFLLKFSFIFTLILLFLTSNLNSVYLKSKLKLEKRTTLRGKASL